MKTPEEIQHEIQKLAVVAAAGSPVPDAVRYAAQNVCHTLSWVLNDDVSISPYNVIAGCCCTQPRPLPSNFNPEHCSIGPGMCLSDDWNRAIGTLPCDFRGFCWTKLEVKP